MSLGRKTREEGVAPQAGWTKGCRRDETQPNVRDLHGQERCFRPAGRLPEHMWTSPDASARALPGRLAPAGLRPGFPVGRCGPHDPGHPPPTPCARHLLFSTDNRPPPRRADVWCGAVGWEDGSRYPPPLRKVPVLRSAASHGRPGARNLSDRGPCAAGGAAAFRGGRDAAVRPGCPTRAGSGPAAPSAGAEIPEPGRGRAS